MKNSDKILVMYHLQEYCKLHIKEHNKYCGNCSLWCDKLNECMLWSKQLQYPCKWNISFEEVEQARRKEIAKEEIISFITTPFYYVKEKLYNWL